MNITEPIEYEDFDGDDEAIDLRVFSILGGIYHFSLIHLPPQPIIANSWSMTIGESIVFFLSEIWIDKPLFDMLLCIKQLHIYC